MWRSRHREVRVWKMRGRYRGCYERGHRSGSMSGKRRGSLIMCGVMCGTLGGLLFGSPLSKRCAAGGCPRLELCKRREPGRSSIRWCRRDAEDETPTTRDDLQTFGKKQRGSPDTLTTDGIRVVEPLEIPSACGLLTFPVDLFCSEEADPILPGSFLAKAPKNQCL